MNMTESSIFLYWPTPSMQRCHTDNLMPAKCPYLAVLQAVWTPKFKDWRPSSIVLSQVVLGRPTGLLQSAGGLSAAAMTRWWSSSGAIWARCPKSSITNTLRRQVRTSLRVQSKPWIGRFGCSRYGLYTTPEICSQFFTADTSPKGTYTVTALLQSLAV